MLRLSSKQKKSTFASTMKGYNKYIVEALKKMQGGEELEMGAENCRELDQAKRDVRDSIEDVIQFAEAILKEAKAMQDIY